MVKVLQQFDFRQSLYQRPNQEWRCGRQRLNRWQWTNPCHIGPDAKGRCRATSECDPILDDNRWICTRSSFSGGRCEQGPGPDGTCCRPIAPCNPIQSWRARISNVSRWATLLTVGFLLVIFTSSYSTQFIDPGELTFQHSRVGSCGGCHSSYELGILGWPHAAFTRVPEVEDSKRCMNCHAMGENAFDPHGLSKPLMAKMTTRAEKSTKASIPWAVKLIGAAVPHRSEGGDTLPCMACHQEHRGQAAELTKTSNERCTACHTAQFSSFSDGHPRFKQFPFKRRTRIAFDHEGHFKTHFKGEDFKAKAPSGCFGCHTPDVRGSTMIVKGFDAACADCHAAQIEGVGRASEKGFDVLNVPGLDVLSLAEQEVAIGSWPEDAEGEITPFMDFLMSVDTGYTEARELLADVDLLDLADSSDDQVAAVKTIAWSVKALLYELAVEGMPALHERMEKVLGHGLTNMEAAGLAGLLPAAVIREAQVAWFPNLYRDVPKHAAGEEVPIPEDDENEEEEDEVVSVDLSSGEDWHSTGGWYRDEFSIYYRPIGHEDGMIVEWLTLTAERTTKGNLASNSVFDYLADSKAPGRCTKCHSVDVTGKPSKPKFVVNWLGRRPLLDAQEFTTFSHTAHFPLLDAEGCVSCHNVNDGAKPMNGYKDRDPNTFESNFSGISRKTCAECHTTAGSADSCTTCHNYHIGKFSPAIASSPKMMAGQKKQD